MVEENEISGLQVLRGIYETLFERHGGQEIKREENKRFWTEVANDCEPHRRRYGSMVYPRAASIVIGQRPFVLFWGNETSGYPAAGYGGDLSALDVKKNFGKLQTLRQKELLMKDLYKNSTYFANSLLGTMADGRLFTHKNSRFFGPSSKLLQDRKVKSFLRGGPEFDRSLLLTSTLGHPITKPAHYDPALVDFLTEGIEKILEAANDLAA